MSYRLGISHFPALHRQWSSPMSEKFPDPPDEDLTEDSKDVLIDRLSDLVQRLSKVSSLKDSAVSAIHREVDKIELLVHEVEKTDSPNHLVRENSGHSNDDDFWGPLTPTQNMRMSFPNMSQYSSPKAASAAENKRAAEVAEAAEELAAKLASTFTQLAIRKEESDRIHDLLVMRAEKAAERILVLEQRITEMDDDYLSSQSELKFLRIKLQATQVQCTNCIHRHDDDPELTDSINNWKIDWEAINRQGKTCTHSIHKFFSRHHFPFAPIEVLFGKFDLCNLAEGLVEVLEARLPFNSPLPRAKLAGSSSTDISSPASTSSSSDRESDWNQRQHIDMAGEQLPSPDIDVLDLNSGSDLEVNNGSQIKLSAAVVAPFRGESGVPHIADRRGDSSEVTDFGESLCRKVRSKSQKPPSSISRRRPKKPKKSLQDRLFSALVPTHEDGKEFFPRSVLSSIINEERVYEELSKHLADAHHEQTIRRHARSICGIEEEDGTETTVGSHKIFVILVLIDKTSAITKFLELGLCDRDLPLQLVKHQGGSKELRLSRCPDKRLRCFDKSWKQLHIKNFESYQWTTLSPFFARGEHSKVTFYQLQPRAILPFIAVEQEGRTNGQRTLEFVGGFSRVSKVDIHPDHHNFHSHSKDQASTCFAVKCLHSRDKSQFDKEVEMLERFSDYTVPAHKHLISLLATYSQFDNYFLIFHWADADLRRYWMEVNSMPIMDRETVIWMVQQCTGIAEGVQAIHQSGSFTLPVGTESETFGHHGDIKPENILWFRDSDRGTLKLSDFGLAEINIHTKSMQRKSNYATSVSYQAPEVEIEGTGAIGRSYDMWTLGCLYLEFCCYQMGGWDLVARFNSERIPQDFVPGQDATTFYTLKPVKAPDGKWKQKVEIKTSVSDFIARLLADESCTDFLCDFLEMIRDNLLVIKTHDHQQRDRLTSQEVFTRLSRMFHRCQNDVGYGYKSTVSSEAASLLDEIVVYHETASDDT
ncbi:hypothetical protein VTL71DRAFT_10656 [Oculimacula yallundae]|uniref:Protein kinase domain-containing protein n=1 Tax=Oculimacula yallundae TaxID=86028 RepID=A0ABR4CU43_9HELO